MSSSKPIDTEASATKEVDPASAPEAADTPVISTGSDAVAPSPSSKNKAKFKEGSMENFIRAAMDACSYLAELGTEIGGNLSEWIKKDPGGLQKWIKDKAESSKESVQEWVENSKLDPAKAKQNISDFFTTRAAEIKQAVTALAQPGQDQKQDPKAEPTPTPSEARITSLKQQAQTALEAGQSESASASPEINFASLNQARQRSVSMGQLPPGRFVGQSVDELSVNQPNPGGAPAETPAETHDETHDNSPNGPHQQP